VFKEFDLFIAHSIMFDSSNIHVISNEENICNYERISELYESNISDGYIMNKSMKITARKTADEWKIDDYEIEK